MASYFMDEAPESTPDFVFSNIQKLLVDLPGDSTKPKYAIWLNEHYLGLENQSKDLVTLAPDYKEELAGLFDYHSARIAERSGSIADRVTKIARLLGNTAIEF